jgi:ankyrin repeat protein
MSMSTIKNSFILIGLSNESDKLTIDKIVDICKPYNLQLLHLYNNSSANKIQHIAAAFLEFKPQMFEVFRDITFIESGLIIHFKPSDKYHNTMNILVLSESLYNHFTIDVIMEEPYPASLLHAAVLNKEFNILVHLMEFTKNPNIGTKEAKTTALHIAAKEAYMDELELLLSHPLINVNARDILDDTPLTIASLENKTESMRRLLQHPDIDIKHVNSSGQNALYGGIINNNLCIIDMILNHESYKNLDDEEYTKLYDEILNLTNNNFLLSYCYDILFSEYNDDSPNKINSNIAKEIINGRHLIDQLNTVPFTAHFQLNYYAIFIVFVFIQISMAISSIYYPLNDGILKIA